MRVVRRGSVLSAVRDVRARRSWRWTVKKTLIVILVLLLSLLVACEVDAPQTPDALARVDAATAPLPYLLPDATLLAVEVRGLSRRWSEIRSVRPLADFQDRLLSLLGVASDDLPSLAGDHLVLALVSASKGRTLVPVALIRAGSVPADSVLASIDEKWAVIRAREAVWVGPTGAADELERIARGDGTSLAQAIAMDESDQRLPPGGLVRGWVNPTAVRDCVQAKVAGPWAAALELVRSLIAADLDVMRWFGFRRDIEAGRVVTDAVAVYDTEALPREVARVFDPNAAAPSLAFGLPDDVVLVAGFRPEPDAVLPWLRHVARTYAESPLRNLDFWVGEFEERSGRDLQRDLFGSMGDRAWMLGMGGHGNGFTSWVSVFESPDPFQAKTTLLALREWSTEHAWVRTLGLAVPHVHDYVVNGVESHAIVVHTPFGDLTGPTLVALDGYLLIAADEHAMRVGMGLAEDGAFAGTPPTGEGVPTPPHMALELSGRAVLGMVEFVRDALPASRETAELFDVVAALVVGISSASVRCWYEADAIRMRGEIVLSD